MCSCAPQVSHETFITHNGDLDFYTWHGITYDISDVFIILEHVLHLPPVATVDSMGVAWLLDVLRTKGMWRESVRYGYLFGGLKLAGNLTIPEVLNSMWDAKTLDRIANEFETAWRGSGGTWSTKPWKAQPAGETWRLA